VSPTARARGRLDVSHHAGPIRLGVDRSADQADHPARERGPRAMRNPEGQSGSRDRALEQLAKNTVASLDLCGRALTAGKLAALGSALGETKASWSWISGVTRSATSARRPWR
jgi:hypothetical protein